MGEKRKESKMTYTKAYRVDSRVLTKNPKLICFTFNNPESNTKDPVLAMIQKLSSDLNLFESEAKTLITVEVYPIGLRG